jgi:hypothetical protein
MSHWSSNRKRHGNPLVIERQASAVSAIAGELNNLELDDALHQISTLEILHDLDTLQGLCAYRFKFGDGLILGDRPWTCNYATLQELEEDATKLLKGHETKEFMEMVKHQCQRNRVPYNHTSAEAAFHRWLAKELASLSSSVLEKLQRGDTFISIIDSLDKILKERNLSCTLHCVCAKKTFF